MKKVVNEMKLEFPSQSNNEGFARSAVAYFVAQMDPTLDELEDIKTAVSEAVTNVIIHAYPEMIGPVYLKVQICPQNMLKVIIRDRGKGILNIDEARQPMFTTGGEERSGMGFTIMESFMDEVTIRSRLERGTMIIMKKRFSTKPNAKNGLSQKKRLKNKA